MICLTFASCVAAAAVVSRKPTKDETTQVESAVKARLKDPNSAMFSAVVVGTLSDGTTRACGLVNAKNGMGGYSGKQAFMVQLEGANSWIREFDNGMTFDQARAACYKAGLELPNL
jgi:hypothetical protein